MILVRSTINQLITVSETNWGHESFPDWAAVRRIANVFVWWKPTAASRLRKSTYELVSASDEVDRPAQRRKDSDADWNRTVDQIRARLPKSIMLISLYLATLKTNRTKKNRIKFTFLQFRATNKWSEITYVVSRMDFSKRKRRLVRRSRNFKWCL